VWLGLRGSLREGERREGGVHRLPHGVLRERPVGTDAARTVSAVARDGCCRSWGSELGPLLCATSWGRLPRIPIGRSRAAHCIVYTRNAGKNVVCARVHRRTWRPGCARAGQYLAVVRRRGLCSSRGGGRRAGRRLTSLWCLYAALVSVLILEHFRRQRRRSAGGVGRQPVTA